MAKYKYTPFCPHCGKQNIEDLDICREINRPELFKQPLTCQHCKKYFTAYDVIYQGKEVIPNYTKMLMHCIPDIAPRHDIIFRWVWNDMLLDPGYTLQFEYKGNNYEIYAPMVNDHYLSYLDTYLDLAQQIVEDYLDEIDKKERLIRAKYMYFPICSYCGMQAMDVIEMETEITKPEWVRAVRTCIWCGKDFMEYDVIEPREHVEDSGIYMQLMRNLEDPEFKEKWKKKARDILYKAE